MDEEALQRKREKEKQTVRFMIEIYCHRKHKTRGEELCTDCSELASYAAARTDRCPRMEEKTFCSGCKIHCYKPEMREKIREVMRFSGPRMLIYCPKMFLRHLRAKKSK